MLFCVKIVISIIFIFFSMQQHVRLHSGYKAILCDCQVGPKIFSQYFNVCLQKGTNKDWYCIPVTGLDNSLLVLDHEGNNGSNKSGNVNGNEQKHLSHTIGESGVKSKQEESREYNVAGEILNKQTALLRDMRVNTDRFKPINSVNIEKKPFVAKRIEAPKRSIKSRLTLPNQKSVNPGQASGSSGQSRARVFGKN